MYSLESFYTFSNIPSISTNFLGVVHPVSSTGAPVVTLNVLLLTQIIPSCIEGQFKYHVIPSEFIPDTLFYPNIVLSLLSVKFGVFKVGGGTSLTA